MRKQRWLLGAALMASLVLGLSAPSWALNPNQNWWENPFHFPDTTDSEDKGETALGVKATGTDIRTLSCEIPLYMTMVVVDNKAEVYTPSNYTILNTSQDATMRSNGIAVVDMTLTRINQNAEAGKAYEIADITNQTLAENQIRLSIGGVAMPTFTGNSDVETVQIFNPDYNYKGISSTIFTADNAFISYQTDGNPTFRKITGTNPLNLAVEAEVSQTVREEWGGQAVPQYKVKYTISPLDINGNPIGVVYEGPQLPETATKADGTTALAEGDFSQSTQEQEPSTE